MVARTPEREDSNARLKAWVQRHGATQAELAALTPYSQAMWSQVLSGKRRFSPVAMMRVARCLGVPLSEIHDHEHVEQVGA